MSLLLDAAAEVFEQTSYDAATLTEIAARAGTSIGSLYQYFPDKTAVALALAERYRTELIDSLTPLVIEASRLKTEELVTRMFEVVTQLMNGPAFLSVVTAPIDFTHVKAGRTRLRNVITSILRAHHPKLILTDAARMAEVIVQIFKAMNRASNDQSNPERQALTREFNLVLASYLKAKLRT